MGRKFVTPSCARSRAGQQKTNIYVHATIAAPESRTVRGCQEVVSTGAQPSQAAGPRTAAGRPFRPRNQGRGAGFVTVRVGNRPKPADLGPVQVRRACARAPGRVDM